MAIDAPARKNEQPTESKKISLVWKILFRIFKVFEWLYIAIIGSAFAIVGLFLVLCLTLVLLTKITHYENCAPGEKIESTATNSKGFTAEMHICPDGLWGYHYYVETVPEGPFLEMHPRLSDGQPAPSLEWVDDATLKIMMPKNMHYHDSVQSYNGIKIIYSNKD